jgi:plasmid stabilization system protein ParE
MPRVFFTADARADLDDALGWYAMQAPEIAPQFQEALRVVVARISDNPKQFPHHLSGPGRRCSAASRI